MMALLLQAMSPAVSIACPEVAGSQGTSAGEFCMKQVVPGAGGNWSNRGAVLQECLRWPRMQSLLPANEPQLEEDEAWCSEEDSDQRRLHVELRDGSRSSSNIGW